LVYWGEGEWVAAFCFQGFSQGWVSRRIYVSVGALHSKQPAIVLLVSPSLSCCKLRWCSIVIGIFVVVIVRCQRNLTPFPFCTGAMAKFLQVFGSRVGRTVGFFRWFCHRVQIVRVIVGGVVMVGGYERGYFKCN